MSSLFSVRSDQLKKGKTAKRGSGEKEERERSFPESSLFAFPLRLLSFA
jgi:hypothetical protein